MMCCVSGVMTIELRAIEPESDGPECSVESLVNASIRLAAHKCTPIMRCLVRRRRERACGENPQRSQRNTQHSLHIQNDRRYTCTRRRRRVCVTLPFVCPRDLLVAANFARVLIFLDDHLTGKIQLKLFNSMKFIPSSSRII